MTSPPVPPQAIEAAAGALWHLRGASPGGRDQCEVAARAALGAAAPHLATAERERCAQLAEAEANRIRANTDFTVNSTIAATLDDFAALLREAQP